jgi:Arc/MetJ-type ribon-helix-helix transcriptional regulator
MVYGWWTGVAAMATAVNEVSDRVVELRPPTGESEKLTINLGVVDLGQIDLLVSEGFYSNRTDLIRTAIRNQLSTHRDAISQSIVRRSLTVGLKQYGRDDLERILATGEMLQIDVVGLLRIDRDVTPELALATIQTISVLGSFQASPAVRAALADRQR